MESSNHLTKSGGEGPASGKGWATGKSKEGGEKAWHATSQAAGETEAQSRVTWPHLQAPEASRAWDFRGLPTPVSENPNSKPRAESELTRKCLAAAPVVRSQVWTQALRVLASRLGERHTWLIGPARLGRSSWEGLKHPQT